MMIISGIIGFVLGVASLMLLRVVLYKINRIAEPKIEDDIWHRN